MNHFINIGCYTWDRICRENKPIFKQTTIQFYSIDNVDIVDYPVFQDTECIVIRSCNQNFTKLIDSIHFPNLKTIYIHSLIHDFSFILNNIGKEIIITEFYYKAKKNLITMGEYNIEFVTIKTDKEFSEMFDIFNYKTNLKWKELERKNEQWLIYKLFFIAMRKNNIKDCSISSLNLDTLKLIKSFI